jgi:hypothetical protein
MTTAKSKDPSERIAHQSGGKKSALFLLIDAMRFDTMADPVAAKFLFPNLAKIAAKGSVSRVVANAQSTQFIMPSLFSLTYPLDHGGYDTGIRLRPRSFVEVLKEAGWKTRKIVTVNQLGVSHGYERGFDTVKTATDFRIVLEHNLDRTLSHGIDLWKRGETSEEDAVEFFHREFGIVLDQLEKIWESFDQSLWTPRLRHVNGRVARGLSAERALLDENPVLIMNKVAFLSGAAYWRFLGDRSINRFRRFFWHGIGFVQQKIRKAIVYRSFPPFFFLGHLPLVLPDVIAKVCSFMEGEKAQRPWFAYMHFMDIHDCRAFNRPLRVMARWRFLPRWWLGKFRGHTNRRFAYDTALMAVDVCVGKLIRTLARTGQLDDLLLLITGDHGSNYAENPRGKKGLIEVLTHYEDIEVPMILVGAEPLPADGGLIDSMGVTATLLEALGAPTDPSFKGVSAYAGGRDAIISESCGRGAADLARREIYFTVSTKNHRMMATLGGSDLQTTELYDIVKDPKELVDIASDPGSAATIAALKRHIYREREELLALRGVKMPEK